MIRAYLFLLPGVLLLIMPGEAAAQCQLAMNAAQCQAAVETALREEGVEILADDPATVIADARQITASSTEDALRLFNTGLSSVLGDGGISTLEDFLPKFKLFASGGGSNDDADRIVFEVNDILGLPTDDGYKFSAVLTKPTVFEPLLQTVAEDLRANEKDTLEEEIDDLDDVTISFTYSPMTEKWGRSDHQLHASTFNDLFLSAEQHAGELEIAAETLREATDDAIEEAVENADMQVLMDWSQSGRGFCAVELAKNEVLSNIEDFDFDLLTGDQLLCAVLAADAARTDAVQSAATSQATRTINAEATTVVENYLSGIAGSIREEYRNLATLRDSLTAVGFFGFPELINNQPQFNFSASYRNRDQIVGQNEVRVDVSYERGFVNVNDFRSFAGNSCSDDALYLCLGEYLTPARKRQLERGDRVTFNLAYARMRSYDVTLDSGAGMLNLPSATSLTASLGYGRYLNFLESGAGNSRLEISASYEDVDGDSMRQDRLFSTLTYSQRISDMAALSFSFVYANKPEYRGEVGDEISANLGINYKMFSSKEF